MHADDLNSPYLDWPVDAGEKGREVWYGLVSSPVEDLALWYRYTLLSTVDGRREGRVWAGITDRGGGDSTFVSESVPLGAVHASGDPFGLEIGDDYLTSSGAEGYVDGASTDGDDATVAWNLNYDPDDYVFTPLRSERLTDVLSRFAGTGRHWSRNEAVRVDGEVTVDGRTVEFSNAPGHQGHTLGADPPSRWTWVQCNDFDDESVGVECLDLGGTLSMCLRRDGEVHALNRVTDIILPGRNKSWHNEVGEWTFSGSGEGGDLRVTVEADPDCWQRVAYLVPDESLRYNAHCSLATVTLRFDHGGEPRVLESDHGRVEWVNTEKPIPGTYRPAWG